MMSDVTLGNQGGLTRDFTVQKKRHNGIRNGFKRANGPSIADMHIPLKRGGNSSINKHSAQKTQCRKHVIGNVNSIIANQDPIG